MYSSLLTFTEEMPSKVINSQYAARWHVPAHRSTSTKVYNRTACNHIAAESKPALASLPTTAHGSPKLNLYPWEDEEPLIVSQQVQTLAAVFFAPTKSVSAG